MRTTPVVAVLLIGLTAVLEYALSMLNGWHGRLYIVDGFDRHLIALHHEYLQIAAASLFGLILLSLGLIILLWKSRYPAWLVVGMMVLWVILVCYPLLGPIA